MYETLYLTIDIQNPFSRITKSFVCNSVKQLINFYRDINLSFIVISWNSFKYLLENFEIFTK